MTAYLFIHVKTADQVINGVLINPPKEMIKIK